MRLELFQKDVRGDLKQDVRYKKYGERRVVFRALQLKILLQAKDRSIGDVRPVEKG